jgi:hypothetical protein
LVTADCGIQEKLASFTLMSISSFPVSSVIVILLLHALIFLNSKLTHVFCLNTHTQAVPILEAVLFSQPHQDIVISQEPSKEIQLIVLIFVPETSVFCFVQNRVIRSV